MVEEFDVIDAAGPTPDGKVGLMMFEPRNWSKPQRQLKELHKKTQSYLSYVVDGDMVRENPNYANRQVWVRLVCNAVPPPAILPYLTHLKVALAKHSIEFQVAHYEPENPSTSVNNLVAI